MEPLNNGHFGTGIILLLHMSEVKLYCHDPVGTTKLVLSKKVKCIVSFIWKILLSEVPLYWHKAFDKHVLQYFYIGFSVSFGNQHHVFRIYFINVLSMETPVGTYLYKRQNARYESILVLV